MKERKEKMYKAKAVIVTMVRQPEVPHYTLCNIAVIPSNDNIIELYMPDEYKTFDCMYDMYEFILGRMKDNNYTVDYYQVGLDSRVYNIDFYNMNPKYPDYARPLKWAH